MATNNSINYDDERFRQVESSKQQALTDVENTYGGMIGEADKYYQAQIDASKEWANTQQQLQQDNTDFAIEKIEQQKAQAQKDYTKEQAGAYTDWQKQSNAYGVNAEQMASSGLTNTGYSESSKVSMYNTYQNRVATARESYNLAVMNYNNSIKDAQLQNNSKLAEIAYNALQQQLELSLQGFQYKNQLLIEQANKKMEVDNAYYGRYQDVLNQMNTENAMAEEIRQYNESLALQKEQFNEGIRQYEEGMAFQKDQFAEEVRQYNESLLLQKDQLAEEIRQYNENAQFQREQFNEEIRQYEQSYKMQVKQFDESIRQFETEMERLKKKDAQEHAMEIERLAMQKQQMEQAKFEAERDYQLKQQQIQLQQAQYEKDYQLKVQQMQAQQEQFEKEYQLSQQKLAEDTRQFNASLNASKSSSNNNSAVINKDNGSAVANNKSGSISVPTLTTYEQATAFMRDNGLTAGDGGLMTQSEWARRKKSASGQGTAEAQYSSYSEYITAFVQWRAENPEK